MKLFVGAKGIVHRDGKVLLLREASEYSDGTEAGKWDVPGGRIEPGEAVRDGLIREVLEESGLQVTPTKILDVFDGFPEIDGEKCHVVRTYFLCETMGTDVTLSSDHDSYEWVDPSDIGNKILMNDIAEMLAMFKDLKI